MSTKKYTNDGIIVVDGLKKRSGDVKAANGTISQVRPGEAFGLLGPDRSIPPRTLPCELPLGAPGVLEGRFIYVSFSNISVYSLLYMS
jgi:hypothetical protein